MPFPKLLLGFLGAGLVLTIPGSAATQTTVLKETRSFEKSGTASSSSSSSRISKGPVTVETADGQGKVLWKGQPVFTGPMKGAVTARSGKDEGKEIGAVFVDGGLLWESQAGASKKLGSGGATAGGFSGGQAGGRTSAGSTAAGGAGGGSTTGGKADGGGSSRGTSGGTNISGGATSGGRIVVSPVTPPGRK